MLKVLNLILLILVVASQDNSQQCKYVTFNVCGSNTCVNHYWSYQKETCEECPIDNPNCGTCYDSYDENKKDCDVNIKCRNTKDQLICEKCSGYYY